MVNGSRKKMLGRSEESEEEEQEEGINTDIPGTYATRSIDPMEEVTPLEMIPYNPPLGQWHACCLEELCEMKGRAPSFYRDSCLSGRDRRLAWQGQDRHLVKWDGGLTFGKWRDGRLAKREGGLVIASGETAVSPIKTVVSICQMERRSSRQIGRRSRHGKWRDGRLPKRDGGLALFRWQDGGLDLLGMGERPRGTFITDPRSTCCPNFDLKEAAPLPCPPKPWLFSSRRSMVDLLFPHGLSLLQRLGSKDPFLQKRWWTSKKGCSL
ncbi:unnamed protein product, partial [Sphenostylis stenocarpa]